MHDIMLWTGCDSDFRFLFCKVSHKYNWHKVRVIFWRLVIMLWTGWDPDPRILFCKVSHLSHMYNRHKVKDNKNVRVASLETCHYA